MQSSTAAKSSKTLTPEESAVIFKNLGVDPLNQFCFDCQSRNPSWASLEFGVRICLECAAHHRQMGTHITFVRSINYDCWRVEQLLLMLLGGNRKASAFLKANGGSGIGEVPSTGHAGKYTDAAAKMYRQQLKHDVAEGQAAMLDKMVQLVPRVAEIISLTSSASADQMAASSTAAVTPQDTPQATAGVVTSHAPVPPSASAPSTKVTAGALPASKLGAPVLIDPALLSLSSQAPTIQLPAASASTLPAAAAAGPSQPILRLGSVQPVPTNPQLSALSTAKGKSGVASIGSLLGPKPTASSSSTVSAAALAPTIATPNLTSVANSADEFDFGTW